MAGLTFYEILQQASLDKYHQSLTSRGIHNPANLLSLTMQDYPTLGITSMHDREKLFNLIQTLKGSVGESSKLMETPTAGRKVAVKRPRDNTKNSPSLGKIKSKTQIIESYKLGTDGKKTPTPLRSRPLQMTPITAGYNYGVPTAKFKTKVQQGKRNLVEQGQSGIDSSIKVCVRKRPLSREEIENGEEDVVEVTEGDTVNISAPKVTVDLAKYVQKYPFVFDEVFDEKCTNREVYEKTAKPLVSAIFSRGVKATCFACGCTGSGKTYTMLGTEDIPGLYLLAAGDIFAILHSSKHGHGLEMWVSFYEIYCGQLFDLLNGRTKLFARENAAHQVCIVGLTEKCVNNVEELMEVIESGGDVRSMGATGVNADSSRSHAVLQLELKGDTAGVSLGRFSFIDLAGSERAADVTNTDKQTRMEGAEINQSLLALKECIRSLDQDSKHTPFRQSKLTQVLKDSFVGNTMTCMIANISPNMSSCENTLNTLRYASRAKELKKENGGSDSPRPVTVHGTDSKSWPQTISMTVISRNNLPTTRSQGQHAKTGSSEQLNKALKRLKMEDTEITGNSRPHTMATMSRISSKTRETNGTRDTVLPTAAPTNELKAESKTSKEILETQAVVAPKSQSTPYRGKSRFASKRKQSNVLKIEQKHIPEVEIKPTRPLAKTKCGTYQSLDGKAETVQPRNKSRFTARPKSTNLLKVDQSKTKEHKEGLEAAITLPVAMATQDKARQGSYSTSEESKDASVASSALVSRFASRRKQNSRPKEEEVHRQMSANNMTSQLQTHVPVTGRSKFMCTKSADAEMVQIECQGSLTGQQRANTSNKPVDQEESPPMNNRYSKRIKARLVRLFNGKPGEDDHMMSAEQESPMRTKRHLEPIPNSQVSPHAISQEQVVAAHHTQLAMVTGLCHEEMVLLKQIDKGEQDFAEYVDQLDDILMQKKACITSLQEKLSRWKARKT